MKNLLIPADELWELTNEAVDKGFVPIDVIAQNIAHDLKESIESDIKEIAEYAKEAAQEIAKSVSARMTGEIDDAQLRAILESYWRSNRSRVARIGDRTARRTLISTLKAVIQIVVGATGGVASLAALNID